MFYATTTTTPPSRQGRDTSPDKGRLWRPAARRFLSRLVYVRLSSKKFLRLDEIIPAYGGQ